MSGGSYQRHGVSWSITVYGDDGYMKSDNNILNAANVVLDGDGRFTARFGSLDTGGEPPTGSTSAPGGTS